LGNEPVTLESLEQEKMETIKSLISPLIKLEKSHSGIPAGYVPTKIESKKYPNKLIYRNSSKAGTNEEYYIK